MHVFIAMAPLSPFMSASIMMVVVFSALVVLSLVISLFAKFGSNEKKNDTQSAVVSAPVQKAVTVPAAAPSTMGGDDDEIAAVIAAAVAMMAPAGVTYRVRRITPAGGRGRSEWAAAAVRQNTMPF